MSKPRFVKVSMGLFKRPVLMEVGGETGSMISGYQVNKQGEKIEKVVNGEASHVLIVAMKEEVMCEMTMNLHYGELEREDTCPSL